MKEKIEFLFKDKNTKVILFLFLILGLFVFFTQQKNQDDQTVQEEIKSADTIIPKGFVLVPIEIQNIESLSSLIGGFGLVDLFTTQQINQQSGLRVGRRLKLLRAPLNPNTFAVLVPENEASSILSANGPFMAVVQNPNNTKATELIKKSNRMQIEYFKGGN